MKVDFFIAGAPKAGTTSLYHYLSQHKEVEMSSVKEPDYFSYNSLKEKGTYYGRKAIGNLEQYHKLFTNKKNLIRGEASVSYLYYEGVARKIKEYNKNAKIIIILRNPVERAFSHYLMDYRLGLVSENFEDIINKKINHKNASLYYQQYLLVGEYYQQIKRFINVFGADNLLIINYEDFKNNLPNTFKQICLFLKISDTFKANFKNSYNTYIRPRNKFIRRFYSFVKLRKILSTIIPKGIAKTIIKIFFTSSKKPKLTKATRTFLNSYYREDIIRLSKLLKRDFSSWEK